MKGATASLWSNHPQDTATKMKDKFIYDKKRGEAVAVEDKKARFGPDFQWQFCGERVGALPPQDWETVHDEHGREYYWNTKTNPIERPEKRIPASNPRTAPLAATHRSASSLRRPR